MALEFKDYLFSSHGTDYGYSYVLPKNVRVVLPCTRTVVSADDYVDSKLWSSFMDKTDLELNYLNDILIDTLGVGHKYCVFSGNLPIKKNNIIPDIYLTNESVNFRSGLFKAPLNFKRVFLKDYFSRTDEKQYLSGDIENINMDEFKRQLVEHDGSIPPKGFLRYFLTPGEINQTEYQYLDFVLINDKDKFKSFDYFHRSIYPNKDFSLFKYEKKIDDTDLFRIPNKSQIFDIKMSKEDKEGKGVSYDEHYLKKNQIHKLTKPQTDDVLDKMESYIIDDTRGFFISDIIRHLCNLEENKNKFITITFSVCRSSNFLPIRDLTPWVKASFMKGTYTEKVRLEEYRSDYLKDDIDEYQKSLEEYHSAEYSMSAGGNKKYKINY